MGGRCRLHVDKHEWEMVSRTGPSRGVGHTTTSPRSSYSSRISQVRLHSCSNICIMSNFAGLIALLLSG